MSKWFPVRTSIFGEKEMYYFLKVKSVLCVSYIKAGLCVVMNITSILELEVFFKFRQTAYMITDAVCCNEHSIFFPRLGSFPEITFTKE